MWYDEDWKLSSFLGEVDGHHSWCYLQYHLWFCDLVPALSLLFHHDLGW